MGTMATLTLASTVDADEVARARHACEFSLAADEHRFSHYDERSEIVRWLKGEPIGDDALRDIRAVMDECMILQIASDGVFSPFDPSTGRLDTAGYAKGHAIAKAVAAVRSVGIRDFSINVGGDTYCSGERAPRRPWHIGIADPARSGGYVFSDVQGPYWEGWRLATSGAPFAIGPMSPSPPPPTTRVPTEAEAELKGKELEEQVVTLLTT
jgi:thiamine biosynthesis lipoprotein